MEDINTADWISILGKGVRIFTDYVINQQDRAVDSMANFDAEKFKIVYQNRANRSEAAKKLIEKAAQKRNWKE